MGVGQILDAGIKLNVGNARTLMGLAATVVVPLQVFTWLVLVSIVSNSNQIPSGFQGFSSTAAQTNTDAAAQLGAQAVLFGAQLIASALTTAACVKAVSDVYLGHPTSFQESLRFAVRRVGPFLAMTILSVLGLVLGFLLLIIPGIWLYAAWSVDAQALLIERRGPAGALGRSRQLVKGRWWPVAGVLIVTGLMTALVGAAVEGGLVGTAFLTGHPSVLLGVTVVTVAAMVSQIIVTPFVASVRTILYYDLRVRREGYDVDLLAEQLGLPAVSLPVSALSADGERILGPESVGQPGGPPFWPPPPGWSPET